MQWKYDLLEKRLKTVDGIDDFRSLDLKELTLVPDLVIPPKFKVLDFKKYDGIECPKIHLAIYYCKLDGLVHNVKLLIHVF